MYRSDSFISFSNKLLARTLSYKNVRVYPIKSTGVVDIARMTNEDLAPETRHATHEFDRLSVSRYFGNEFWINNMEMDMYVRLAS